jgi:tetratricopeptide (TPR) repeat protein
VSDDRLETGVGSRSEEPTPEHDAAAMEVPGPIELPIRGRAWQFPLIAMSLLAILAAVWHRTQTVAAEIDPGSGLQFAQERLAVGDLDAVAASLRDVAADVESHPEFVIPHRVLLADYLAILHAPLEHADPGVAGRVADAYSDAVSVGAELSERQFYRLAICEMKAGRTEEAVDRFGVLAHAGDLGIATDSKQRRHHLLQRQLLEDLDRNVDGAGLLESVATLLSEAPGIGLEAWAVGFRARVRIREGDIAGLVPRLIVDMQRLEAELEGQSTEEVNWSELHVLLGHAYLADGRPVPASERYEFALDRLLANSNVAAEAGISLGRLLLARGEITEAVKRFDAIDALASPAARHRLQARVGLGEAAILRGDHAASARHFRDAASIISSHPDFASSVVEQAVRTAMRGAAMAVDRAGGIADRMEQSAMIRLARDFAIFGLEFSTDDDVRMRALLLVADSHRRSADILIGPEFAGLDLRDLPYESIPLAVRVEANEHFIAAAEAVLELDLLTPSKTYEHDLLWQAAVLYDTGGRPKQALALYQRFVESRADHKNRPEAMYRIAVGLHGLLQLEEAELWYRSLLREGTERPDEKSGYWTKAKVGLARVLLFGSGSGSQLEAESLLRDFLEGREVDPRSSDYRDATFHLGRLFTVQKRWIEAVEVFEPWLDRYATDPRWGECAAMAGIAWASRAKELDRLLDDDQTPGLEAAPISPGYRTELEASYRRSLNQAFDRFEGVVAVFDGLDAPRLSPIQRHLLRVAGLQRGEVLERLGESGRAMAIYREVEQRFAEEPVAIEALVCLANLASSLGNDEIAGKATRRARIKLQRIEKLRRNQPGLVGDPGTFENASSDRMADHGPDLFIGGGSRSLDRWLQLFPPGGRGGAG